MTPTLTTLYEQLTILKNEREATLELISEKEQNPHADISDQLCTLEFNQSEMWELEGKIEEAREELGLAVDGWQEEEVAA